jgi:hypothetical protein
MTLKEAQRRTIRKTAKNLLRCKCWYLVHVGDVEDHCFRFAFSMLVNKRIQPILPSPDGRDFDAGLDQSICHPFTNASSGTDQKNMLL